ncbi:fasciclin domain-containing protein [Aliidiomarina celeris]|uniref:fasciclin domain-containing protein n=1 Tax=Aliidiomarina celeris TaxID=2249428 RepID=UPI000DEB8D56|nr:fasciclin domain-containing protein [Aliidiomarina celeris]
MKNLTTIATSIAIATGLTLSGLALTSTSALAHNHGGDKKESSYEKKETASIAEVAASNGNFQTLVAALQAADLVEALSGDGEFTVFAPTDEAFAALPEGTVETLLMPENRDQLIAVLTYHVVPGTVMSSDLAGEQTYADTLQGQTLNIDASGYGVSVNGGAKVTTADIEASNGVIHVIDTVLLPSE